MPQQWLQPANSEQSADAVSASGNLRQWWRNFDDPLLDALIEAALSGSPTLKAAQVRLQQARALYKGTAGQQYPDVDVVSGITHERRSENALRFPSGSETTLYQAGFDASWELDVFGAVSRQLESAGAKVEAAQMELADAQVTLTAEVARTYIELRTLRQRYRIALENTRHRQEAYELMLARRQAGLVAEFDVAQARAEWASSQATLPDFGSTAASGIART
ncbi:MAG: TolC family protein [Phycisphaerales bacterium]|nr:TolC family protein [Phycisphaerales bacterium]